MSPSQSSERPPKELWDEVFGAYGEEPPFWVTTRSSIGRARSEAEARRLVVSAYGEFDEPTTVSVVQMYVEASDEEGLILRRDAEGATWGPFDFFKVDE